MRLKLWLCLFLAMPASGPSQNTAAHPPDLHKGPPSNTFPIETDISCAAASGQPPATWKASLSADEERRAEAVYRRAIVITAHDHCWVDEDFADQRKAGITVRVIKPLTDGYYRKGADRFPIDNAIDGWPERGRATFALLDHHIRESHGMVEMVRTVADIERIKREGKAGVIASFEGGRPLGGKIENLKVFYHLGLRELQLHWATTTPLKNADGTLSPFAEDVIREMDRLGIVLDISHMPEATYQRALAVVRNPVVISHAAVTFTERSPKGRAGTDNLDDETIRRIAANGGVICLHFLNGYIHPRHGTEYPTVDDLVDHIDRIRSVAGIDYVGLGPDYSPMQGWRWVEGAERMEGMINVVRVMVHRGYSDEEIEKVLGRNLMRVYSKVWKN